MNEYVFIAKGQGFLVYNFLTKTSICKMNCAEKYHDLIISKNDNWLIYNNVCYQIENDVITTMHTLDRSIDPHLIESINGLIYIHHSNFSVQNDKMMYYLLIFNPSTKINTNIIVPFPIKNIMSDQNKILIIYDNQITAEITDNPHCCDIMKSCKYSMIDTSNIRHNTSVIKPKVSEEKKSDNVNTAHRMAISYIN